MKPKKILTGLEKGITTVINLILNYKDQINNSSLRSRHKIIQKIDSILNLDKNDQKYNTLFLEQSKVLLLDHKNDLTKLEVYDTLTKCVFELSLIIKKKYTSILTKTIDVNTTLNN